MMVFTSVIWACLAFTPIAGGKVAGTPLDYQNARVALVRLKYWDFLLWVTWSKGKRISEVRHILYDLARSPIVKSVIVGNPAEGKRR